MENLQSLDVEKLEKTHSPYEIQVLSTLPWVTELELKAQSDNVAATGSEFQARKFPQIFAAFAALISCVCYGCSVGFPAVAMPKLRNDPNFPHPTEDEISMMSSIMMIGALAGNIPTAFATDKFGRRITMIILTVPLIGGWLLVYVAQNVPVLIFGRFVIGFCAGSFLLVAPIFIAETSDSNIRGTLLAGLEVMGLGGIVVASILGKFLDWRTQALVCAFVPLLSFIILLFVPESPRFLLSKGKEDAAFKSFCWYQGASKSQRHFLKEKFHTLLKDIERSRAEALCSGGIKSQLKEFTRKPVRKAFFVVFVLFLFRECSGISAVDLYAVDIFKSAGISSESGSMDAYTLVIGMHAISEVFVILSASLMDRVNRKLLLVPSAAIMTAAFVALGAYFYVTKQNKELEQGYLHFLPPIALLLFEVGHIFGIGPLPLIIMPEILPQNVRAVASMLLLKVKWISSFLVARYFKNYVELVGNAASYWTFSAICLFGTVFILFCLPSNEGKSLEQIQIERNSKKSQAQK